MARASSNGTAITTATNTDAIAAPATGYHLEISNVFVSNSSATACIVTLRDGASGTKYYPMAVGQNGNVNVPMNLKLTTATKLVLITSATGSVEYTIDYRVVRD